ncbi:MAG: DUF4432 family protein [Clostridiaceae bacterium]|jgi:hypothetical protein|nr:DUF4432 family protein [Clostridiaceae bacterium]
MKRSHDMSLKEKLRYTGSLNQLNQVRRVQMLDGPAAGMRLIEVTTESGLYAVFCEDRALDLYEARYRGTNIGYMCKNGLVPGRIQSVSGTFAAGWPGGMLATCGLRNTGPDCVIDGEYHPTHGRIGGMAAENVGIWVDEEQGTITITGEMRESSLGGHHLVMKRRITLSTHTSTIDWEDSIQNRATKPEPVFLLYHVNFGYPFLSPELDLQLPVGEIIPKNEEAEKGLPDYQQISEPIDDKPEHVFFHMQLPDSNPQEKVRLIRKDLRIAASLSWSRRELPWLTEWKMMKAGDYALGIEPTTSRLRGRARELQEGYDQIIKPFETWQYHLQLAFESLDNA